MTIGVDVGSTSVKAVALGRVATGGARVVVGAQELPIGNGTATAASALRSVLERLQTPLRTVTLGVSGPSLILRVVEMPSMNPAELKQALPFEAQRYLPFPVQEVVLDGQILEQAPGKKAWVLVVACKKDVVAKQLALAKEAGVEIGVLDADALALANAFLLHAPAAGGGEQSICAVMNVGAQLTSVVVFRGRTPFLLRDIPWGTIRLLREAAQQLGVEPAEVRRAMGECEPSPELREALKLMCEGLVVELQLSFDYYENQFGRPPDSMFIGGGVSRSGCFVDALRQHLAQTVVPWTPAEGLESQFAVAYGLALRAP
ncbi:MAG TPA: pilus assembly protein PilM [bacterium]